MSDSETNQAPPFAPQFGTLALHWQILIGIVIGIACGTASGLWGGGWDVEVYKLGGSLFMSGLKMLIIPLIASSIIVAIAGMGKQGNFARLGLKTLLYYATTSSLAILIGLCLVNVFAPGEGSVALDDLSIVAGSAEAQAMEKITQRTEGRGLESMLSVVKELVPENIIGTASSNSHMLGVITFALLFGFFLSRLQGRPKESVQSFWEGIYQVMLGMTNLVLRFAPLGICFLIAKSTEDAVSNENVQERFGQLLSFALVVLAALAIHFAVVMPILLSVVAKVNPIRHYKAMGPALLTAFSTASSSSTLPLTMECVHEKAGVSRDTTGFVLPLGATVNMDGTALYECVAVMFVCQLYGIDMGFAEQMLVVSLALLTSIGVAGIPSASLVAIVVILNAVEKQVGVEIGYEAIAFILIFDRFLDMCRTAVNVFGDSCGAVIIASTEGETVLTE